MSERTLIVASEELIDRVLTAATEVHREIGPGLVESIYQAALAVELEIAGLAFQAELPI